MERILLILAGTIALIFEWVPSALTDTAGVPAVPVQATSLSFSALDTILITGFVGTIVSIVTKTWCNRSYMTKSECKLTRESCFPNQIKADIQTLCEGQKEQARLLIEYQKRQADVFRIVLTKMEVPVQEQNKLLDVPIINIGGA